MKNIFTLLLLTIAFVSCKKDDVKPELTSTGPNPISLTINVANKELKTGNTVTVTSECTLTKDTTTYLERSIYLSTDRVFSNEDIDITTRSYNNYNLINYLTNGKNAFRETFFIGTDIDSGSYYVLTRYRFINGNPYSQSYNISYSNYYLVATNNTFTLNDAKSKVSINSISLNNSNISYGGSVVATLNYSSTLGKSVNASLTYGLTTDSTFSTGNIYNLASYSDTKFNSSTGSITKTFNIPSNTNSGVYYLYSTASYVEDGVNYIVKTKFVTVNIKSFINSFTITGLSADKSIYRYGNQILINGQINNGSSQSASMNLYYYFSSDSLYSSNDIPIGNGSSSNIYSGLNSFDDQFTLGSSLNYGSYWLILKAGISIGYYSSNDSYIYFTGPKISYSESVTTITQLSFDTPNLSVSPGSYVNFSTTNKADVTSNTYKYYNVYLSTDRLWTLDDYYVEQEGIDFYPGTKLQSHSFNLPNSLPLATYYLILRSNTSDGSALKEIVSSNTITVANPSIVFYRNTASTISGFNLFIDDIFVYNFSGYTDFPSTNCDNYSSDYSYNYIYRGSTGFHTYKVCTTTNLSTGVIRKSGSFNSSQGACYTIDID